MGERMKAGAAEARSPLPIGVALGTVGGTADWWLESARRLDEAGYAGLWAWDHFMGKGRPDVPVLEQWSTLAAAAAVTRRIGIGSFVTNVMNRHPAVLARAVATVQSISRGRVTLGIAIGGFPREHDAYGIHFPQPRARAHHLDEAVATIRALWTGGPVSRESGLYPLREAVAYPVPDPAPAVLIGSRTPSGVRLAARIGDGWAAESDIYDRLRARYLDALATEGRRREEVRIVVGIGGGRTGEDALGDSPWISEPRDEWARWAARGADGVIVTARTRRDVDALVDAIARW